MIVIVIMIVIVAVTVTVTVVIIWMRGWSLVDEESRGVVVMIAAGGGGCKVPWRAAVWAARKDEEVPGR